MVNLITAVSSDTVQMSTSAVSTWSGQRILPTNLTIPNGDTVQFGLNGQLGSEQALGVVYERAMSSLQSVVSEARAELGLSENDVLDTSNEATANRIADFALGSFNAWWANHEELGEEDARGQFASFIGDAINQGIDEAKGILTALQSLTPEIETDISSISDIISERLADFVANV